MDSWRLDGVAGPHDLAVAPAPLAATGAGDRTLALFVAEAAKNADNHVHKLIVLHPSACRPSQTSVGRCHDQAAKHNDNRVHKLIVLHPSAPGCLVPQ